ncbi:MAG: GNAT family N-acetyltransferase, partial [Burkholderiales bacterium]
MTAVASETEFLPIEAQLRDGRRVIVRAVRLGDKDALQSAIRRLSAEARYARFMSPLRELSPRTLESAVNPQPGRELQLVAVYEDEAREEIVGGARYSAAAGSKDCEFAIAVVDEWQGRGLARQLLEALMRAARAHGFEHMEGYILAGNARMLGLARRLGFVRLESPEGPAIQLLR